jgi:hypothetical protein
MAKLFVCFCSVEHVPSAPGATARESGQEVLLCMNHHLNGMIDFTEQKWQQHGKASNLSLQEAGCQGHSTSISRRRLDFNFSTVVQDILRMINHMYAQFYPDSPGPTPEVKLAFVEYLAANEDEKHGNQWQSLLDFHLTSGHVAFAKYNDMFLSSK